MSTISFLDPSMLPLVSTFLFVFATVFALLSYSRIFVHRDKDGNPTEKAPVKIYAMLAIVFGAFSAAYEPLVTGLQQYIPYAAGLLLLIFFVTLIKKVFEGKKNKNTDTYPILISLVILLLLLATFGNSLRSFLPSSLDPEVVLWVVGIIIVILFFLGIYKYKGGAAAAPGHPQ